MLFLSSIWIVRPAMARAVIRLRGGVAVPAVLACDAPQARLAALDFRSIPLGNHGDNTRRFISWRAA